MSRRASWPWTCALLTTGAFALHQLRYLLPNGESATRALEDSGHGYLAALEPLVGVLIAFGLSLAVWRIVAGRPGARLPGRFQLAAIFAVALLSIYGAQELLEGQLAPGHASGLAAIFGSGGWVAVPLSAALGALLAFCVRAVETVAGSVHRACTRALVRPCGADLAQRPHSRPRRASSVPLATHLAGRAPPLLSV